MSASRTESPVALVARREVSEAFRAKSTKILLVVSVIAIVAVIVIANLASGGGKDKVTLGMVGTLSAEQTASAADLGAAIGAELEIVPLADDAAAHQAVAAGDVDVAVLDGATALLIDTPLADDDTSTRAVLVNVLRADLALTNGLAAAGLDAAQIEAVRTSPPPAIETVHPADDDEADGARLGTALTISILLFVMLQMYGSWVLQGVTREKESRVIEVLLAAATPRQLLIGKVIGIGFVALVNAALIMATALITASIVGLGIASGFRPADVALGAVWFVLGYSLYCGAFAAAGALCSRVEDAQGASLPLMVPLLGGYLLSFSALGSVTIVHWILAFFPPSGVILMPLLYAVGEAQLWHVLVTMALTVACIVAVMLLAARIYERSVLRTGKRLSWKAALSRDAPAT